MKRSDWAAILLIIGIVGLASYFIVGTIMPSPKENLQKVKIAPTISDTVVEPNSKVFSSTAINPTVRATIGDQSDQQPFDVGSN